MKILEVRRCMTLLALGALSVAVPASAVVTTFATFLPSNVSTANMRYNQTGINDGNLFTISTPTDDAPGAVSTRFTFVNSSLASFGILDASFSFFSTVADNSASSVAGFLIQNIDSGSFSFTYSGLAPLIVGGVTLTTGANLLTGTFTDANVFGTVNGSAGSVFGSQPDGSLVYTSDFMMFDPMTAKDFSLAFTSITPLLNRLNVDSSVASFRTNATGAFSNDVTIVPEPHTWGLLFVGFTMVGIQVRRRHSRPRVQSLS